MIETEFITLAHRPDHDSGPATASAASVDTRREILIKGDAHFLQFGIPIT
jgi:hypothetical protein